MKKFSGPTAWHTTHGLFIVSDPIKPGQVAIQINNETIWYPINQIPELVNSLQRMMRETNPTQHP